MEELIHKYLLGQADENETRMLEEWIMRSKENKKDFAKIMNLYAVSIGGVNKVDTDRSELLAILGRIKKQEQRKKVKYFISLGSVAAVVLLFLGIYMFHTITQYKDQAEYVLAQTGSSLEFSTPYGAKSKVVLPDSSVVWMNSGSKIQFPSRFYGNLREVIFSGEGFFEVAMDSLHPMNILTPSGLTVKVLGTKFNLSAYHDDKDFSLMLVSGKVELVSKSGGVLRTMNPSERFTMELASARCAINKPVDTLPIVGWKDGWLIFDDTPLDLVFKNMKRRYGVTVKVEDPSILTKKLSAKFKEESVSQVLDLMHRIALVNYTIKDSLVYISSFE